MRPSNRPLPALRCALPFLAAGFAASLLAATPAKPAPAPGVVELPDMTVTGRQPLPLPESWQYTKLEDGTEVLSNASEGASKRMLRDFQIFQQALDVVWPLPAPATLPARTIILCGRRDKFADFAAPEGAPDMGSASRFLRNRERSAIVVDLQGSEINLAGLVDDAGNSTSSFEVDPYKQLYREYVRYLLSLGNTRSPAWVQEGVAQIVMAMEFTPKWIIIGKIDAQSSAAPTPTAGDGTAPTTDEGESTDAFLAQTAVADRPFNVVLQRRKLVPLEEFFAVTADSPEANNPLGNNRWAKQAYAFVHLCVFGENGRFQQAYGKFVQRLNTEPPSEKLFQECFKLSYAQMLDELRGYISFTNHTYKTYTLKAGSPPLGGAPVVLREATQGEIGRIKGDAQMLAGRTNDALATYHAAYARGERDPALLAALGVAENQSAPAEHTSTILEAAVRAKVARPSAYVELARIHLAAARAKPAAPAGLDAAQVASVTDLLDQARQIPPPIEGTYETLAETLAVSAAPPAKEQLTLVAMGVRLFPHDNLLLYHLARIYAHTGDAASATKVAQMGLRLAPDAAARARFEELLATLSPVPGAK